MKTNRGVAAWHSRCRHQKEVEYDLIFVGHYFEEKVIFKEIHNVKALGLMTSCGLDD
jgi:hypothetical protein